MNWQIWYTDHSTFTSDDGEWEDAPNRGVAVLATAHPGHHWTLHQGFDFYVWWPAQPEPWGCDLFGLWDYLIDVDEATYAGKPLAAHDPDTLPGVKYGRTMTDEAWHDFQKHFRDINEKTGQTPPRGKDARSGRRRVS